MKFVCDRSCPKKPKHEVTQKEEEFGHSFAHEFLGLAFFTKIQTSARLDETFEITLKILIVTKSKVRIFFLLTPDTNTAQKIKFSIKHFFS